ncbi:Oligomycin resistance ATP-dependent permease-like protein [Emericellopsis cladophorae]|uniref:Oligomycin resistance ATP-dependent permease-like protein n=1 Tax=Emericellopsis cladophorae TaxID=2686198 RepID=A0A9P9Y2T4_9HYPO|nr:Oligomycin resistance ATP-dependent permease-like protein [Emericellopsis cladophorae]KAI6782442.1 Oligomycin resistance ATP-dependent permease-like protein [Emericellopsis cladophorae]
MSAPPGTDKNTPQPPDDVAVSALEPTYSRDESSPEDLDELRQKQHEDGESSSGLGTAFTEKHDTTHGADPGLQSDSNSSAHDVEAITRPSRLEQTKSYATDRSAVSARVPVPHKPVDRPWYRKLNPLRWGGIPPLPEEREVSREAKAGFWSRLTFSWMTPLMTTGYKRQLEQGDIWSVNPARGADPLTAKFRESFHHHVQKGDMHPLWKALHETFFWEFWIGGLAALLATILQVTAPFVLRYLIQFATDAWIAQRSDREAPPIGNGIGLTIGVTVMQILQSLGINHFIFNGMMVGGQARGVLIGAIYEKAMVLSGRARAGDSGKNLLAAAAEKDEARKDKKGKGKKVQQPESDGLGWGNGRIVNLMSVDTYRIDQASAMFHMIWTSPVALLITLALLLVNLSYNALAGFGLLVIGAPLLTMAIRSLFRRRKAINKITDQRVSLTQEIIQSVRFVKFFGWEEAFMKRLAEYRGKEIHAIQILLAIRNAINAVGMSLPIFASMLSFISYSLTNPNLPAAEIFSSLALFNGLRIPLNIMPLVLGQAIDAWSSMKRIQEFLVEEEQEDTFITDYDSKHAIKLDHASFTWEKSPVQDTDEKTEKDKKKGTPAKTSGKAASKSQAAAGNGDGRPGSSGEESTLNEEREPFKLQDLNLAVERNELIAVIGGVGSGKSSLLGALASDMRKTGGDVTFGASKAFCPQYAWIQNTIVRNNIIFGKPLNRAWYQRVVEACALAADLEMLPNGDQTEIGERGITISGGQKQRLNIARAIYFDSDIILMDDPLSAVDAHVGRHIFDNAILGLLGDKCRILATHQLWVLNRCDRIVWMENGKIQAVDTFEALMRDHKGFQVLMETTAVEKKEDKKADEEEEDADEGEKKTKKKGGALMQQEERAQASVPWSVYAAYARASGSIWNAPFAVFLLLLSQGANIITSLWLSYWTSDKFGLNNGTYIGIYAALGASQAILMYAFSVYLSVIGTTASKIMLRDAVTRVLRAPMAFFDTTPLGRITNRFSRDVDVMDNNLTDAIRMYSFTIAMVTSIFALIIAFFHFFAVALVPLYILFVLAASYYRASAREVKRYESVLRSHVFAKFGEGLSGVASIKAYGLKQRFVTELRASIDEMNAAYYLTFSNQRWLSIRVDCIGNALVFTVGILVVTSRFDVNPAIAGLVLSYILAIVQMLQFGVRQLAEVENGMNAVERLRYYGTSLEEEAPLHTVEVRPSWPEKGEIIFENVEMRYRENLPLVLSGLSMHVRGGERIGIVGRTGAGKSSIMSTLFRLVEISGGCITIDGLNISTIGLADLRSRLAIIPQDPTLFRGTVRTNLDPFNEHTDLELWSALRQADLIPADHAALPNPTEQVSDEAKDISRIGLDTTVEEDGLNFSLGQRQLMALARALVRGSQIIVCDEATSSVDMETDAKIQNTIATGFRGKTLLCIAHRLRTIVGYDRICVMDAGRIAELDSPLELWKKEGGIFRGMCERSGIRLEDIKGAREEMMGFDGAAASSSASGTT